MTKKELTICDNCGKIRTEGILSEEYAKWNIWEDKDFCNDKCAIEYFENIISLIKKYQEVGL